MNDLMSDIVICIPTENRCEMVREVLEKTIDYYPQYSFRVIYYDSSDDDSTKNVVESFQNRGFHNLSWRRVSKKNSIDQKLFELFRDNAEIRNYKYIWLINDSISITPRFLSELSCKMQEEYSLIRFSPPGFGHKEDVVFTSPNEWFHETSEGMAHMASTIMNTSLLNNVEWADLYEKYVGDDKIGSNRHGYFFTVGFYLEQILREKDFKGLLVNNRIQWRYDCRLKRGKSYWNSIVFEVWAKSYAETILKLPNQYTDKEAIIRKSDNTIFGRFERENLNEFRMKGLLNIGVALEYKPYWKYVSTLSFEEIKAIASRQISETDANECCEILSWEERLEIIEKEIEKVPLIMYGAGMQCEYAVEKLICDGYGELILGIAVTAPENNVEDVQGYKVRCIDEYASLKDRAVVIIATKSEAASEIEKLLKNREYKKIYRIL